LLLFTCGPAQGQTPTIPQPQLGQAGKDLVWVPSPQAVVQAMLDLANVTPHDFVIDLGSGDGVIVIGAAKRGSRAHGIEYNPDLVELSRQSASIAGVSDTATFEKADLFERFLEGHGHHDVSAAFAQLEAAPENSCPRAWHPHRVKHLRHGRLEAGQNSHRAGLRHC
jgi:hypothetical protein